MPVLATAALTASSVTVSGEARTVIFAVSRSNAKLASPPTRGPTARFRTLISSLQHMPRMRNVILSIGSDLLAFPTKIMTSRFQNTIEAAGSG